MRKAANLQRDRWELVCCLVHLPSRSTLAGGPHTGWGLGCAGLPTSPCEDLVEHFHLQRRPWRLQPLCSAAFHPGLPWWGAAFGGAFGGVFGIALGGLEGSHHLRLLCGYTHHLVSGAVGSPLSGELRPVFSGSRDQRA